MRVAKSFVFPGFYSPAIETVGHGSIDSEENAVFIFTLIQASTFPSPPKLLPICPHLTDGEELRPAVPLRHHRDLSDAPAAADEALEALRRRGAHRGQVVAIGQLHNGAEERHLWRERGKMS